MLMFRYSCFGDYFAQSLSLVMFEVRCGFSTGVRHRRVCRVGSVCLKFARVTEICKGVPPV